MREFPPDSLRGRFVRRALQAAVVDVILPAFTEQVLELAAAGQPLTRDLAARASVYLQARTHYGIVEPADLNRLGELWRAVLGEQRPPRARRPVRPGSCGSPTASSTGSTRRPASTGESSASPTRHRAPAGPASPEDPVKAGERPIPATVTAPTPGETGRRRGSLADALEQAIATARAGQLEQLDEDVDLEQVLTRGRRRTAASAASSVAGGGPGCRPGGCPTAASTGRRTPTRCSTPAGTPTGCARRSRRERGRSTSAPRAGASTAAPTPAAAPSTPPAGRSPPIRGGSPGRSPRRSRSRTSG